MDTTGDPLGTFARTISNQSLGLAFYRPESGALPTRCFGNVILKVRKNGGRMQTGWMFSHRPVAHLPKAEYLTAINHAVWHTPDGLLIDVTPFHPNPDHHPITHNGDVVFLVDDEALPVTTGKVPGPLPSRFMALGNDERLVSYIKELEKKEEMACHEIYQGKTI